MLYRNKEEISRTIDDMVLNVEEEWIKEDPNGETTRDLTDLGFSERYKYEATMFSDIIDEVNGEYVLELGSGPGTLAQRIMRYSPQIITYDMIDGPGAVEVHKLRGYDGQIRAIDMMDGLPLNDFLYKTSSYDCIIINDFLEHILNPSSILRTVHTLLADNGRLIVSVPNWRMGHSFFYPGLFDYDNFTKFLLLHKFMPIKVLDSTMKCDWSAPLQSEETLPVSLISSWNWYFICRKREKDEIYIKK